MKALRYGIELQFKVICITVFFYYAFQASVVALYMDAEVLVLALIWPYQWC